MNRPPDQTARNSATPPSELPPYVAPLAVFAGEWKLQGQKLDGPPGEPPPAISGETGIAWLHNNHFLSGQQHTRCEGREHVSLLVFGYDAETSCYHLHFFDDHGAFHVYKGNVEDRAWTFASGPTRMRIDVAEDGNELWHLWERTADGTHWSPLCEFRSIRQGEPT